MKQLRIMEYLNNLLFPPFSKHRLYKGKRRLRFGSAALYTASNESVIKLWFMFNYKVEISLVAVSPDEGSIYTDYARLLVMNHPELNVPDSVLSGRSDHIDYSSLSSMKRCHINTILGYYVGVLEDAYSIANLINIQGHSFEKGTTVSIGFSTDEQRWYGWSHRAKCSFGIGDKLFDKNYGNGETPYIEKGEKTINTIKEAKEVAIAFAEYVS